MPKASLAPRYQPVDALNAPRYTGVRTFARCPAVRATEGVGLAAVGVPFDTGTSYRAGARFGPEAIRSASTLLRPWHPQLEVDVFAQSVVDWGDLAIVPGNARRTVAQIAEGLAPLLDAGVTPLVMGGDHSILLGELRAHAAVDGPVGLVLLDAHADTWDHYYGEQLFHGTPLRRAVEEGVLDPTRSVIAGLRGPLYDAADVDAPREMGFTVVEGDALLALAPQQFGDLVQNVIRDGRTMFSFDVDVLDPAFAPGTGTPEIGGLTPHAVQRYLRALAGIDFIGFDVVEVSPPYDTPGQTTALVAAGIAHELLALSAVARGQRSSQPTRSAHANP
ncbi:MAG: agmatinase [Thermoleophilaceae bacterium]|nr:agmatinase [Thermoleophilaceae bacterium]